MVLNACRLFKISIHALREEGDKPPLLMLSIWHYFYPRPPRGGRQCFMVQALAAIQFLSTPSARRATLVIHFGHCANAFLSTPSARRATMTLEDVNNLVTISIHALREEGDLVFVNRFNTIFNFYPRPPRGGRRSRWSFWVPCWIFLSTPSARRATFGAGP